MRKRIADAYRVLRGDMKAVPRDANWFNAPVFSGTTGTTTTTWLGNVYR